MSGILLTEVRKRNALYWTEKFALQTGVFESVDMSSVQEPVSANEESVQESNKVPVSSEFRVCVSTTVADGFIHLHLKTVAVSSLMAFA